MYKICPSNTHVFKKIILGHHIPEIRQRALRSIKLKLSRFPSGSQREVSFNVNLLIKSLIGWFDHKPTVEVDTVLDLLRSTLMVTNNN